MPAKVDRVLDNPVWHSLTGPRRSLGVLGDKAGRFDPDVSPFAAVASGDDPGAWDELAALVGSSPVAFLHPDLKVPDEWDVIVRIPCVQMLATPEAEGADGDFEPLTNADSPEMLELVERTRPGPFGPRTVEFGGYIGVRDEGRLVAMAGERLRCGAFTEISAVCTDETHRNRGLGTALVRALIHRIRDRGEEAFLHAAADNVTAIRLYEAMGFVVTRELDALLVRAPG